MLLTSDQEMIRDAVRAFAQAELWPHAARWDKEHHFPKEAHRGLAALGQSSAWAKARTASRIISWSWVSNMGQALNRSSNL